MKFTFYGDLLGISSNYKLSPDSAYRKLDNFYNITFNTLSNYCSNNDNFRVFMFSDSLLIYGNEAIDALKHLQQLYINLIENNLLLRGAIVSNKLSFEPRIEMKNFEKKLPMDNTLAKAVGLQNLFKGARLIVENELSHKLFENIPEWLTQEGFYANIDKQVTNSEILKRICPTPDNSSYEYLYFWSLGQKNFNAKKIERQFKEVSKMVDTQISIHYKDTLELMKRCGNRENYFKKYKFARNNK